MYPPYYGAAESFVAGERSPVQSVYDLPGAGGEAQFLSGPLSSGRRLGAAGGQLGATGYGLASVAGAAAGGAITGYLASGDRRGAITGSSFTGGLAALGDAFLFVGERRTGLALMFGLMGVGGIGYSVMRFSRRRR